MSFCCPIHVVSFRSALDQPPETPYWLLPPTPKQGLGRTKQNSRISTNSWEKGVRGVLQLACLMTLATLLDFVWKVWLLPAIRALQIPDEAEVEKVMERRRSCRLSSQQVWHHQQKTPGRRGFKRVPVLPKYLSFLNASWCAITDRHSCS